MSVRLNGMSFQSMCFTDEGMVTYINGQRVGGSGTRESKVSVTEPESIEILVDGVSVFSRHTGADAKVVIRVRNPRTLDSAAATVKVDGNVAGDIRTSSGDVTVQGNVDGNVAAACGDTRVGGSVHGSVSAACGDVKVKGTVANATRGRTPKVIVKRK